MNEARFNDDFRDSESIAALASLVQVREYPRIVTRPDVRVNPRNPRDYLFKGKAVGYGWFPVIQRLHSGELVCAYREGSAHVYSADGRSVVSISKDGGRSWERPIVVYDPDLYTSCPSGIGQATDGTVWLMIGNQYYEKDKGAANDPRAWKRYEVLLKSVDRGQNWKEAWRSEATVGTKPGLSFRTPIELSNGQLVWVAGTTDERGEPIRATCVQQESEGAIGFDIRPHPELGPTSDEWTFVESRHPGVLVCMMRQQQHAHYYATAKSFDYGETWTPWRPSNVYLGRCPTRPWLRSAPDGTLLFCYGQRFIGRTFVVASQDDGESWDIAHRQVHLHSPTEYHHVWDSHYTDIAWAEGTKWLAVDYISSPKRSHQKGIYGTFVDVEYFRDVYRGVTLKQIGARLHSSTKGAWTFDEASGDFARDAVCANYGEIHKARRVPGRLGGALAFDGKSSYVMVYDDATLRVPKYFTLEAWINVADPNRSQTIISKAPRYTLCLKNARFCLEIGKGEMQAEMRKSLPVGRWVHVAVSFGMRHAYSRATFYIDGEEDSWVSPAYGPQHQLKHYEEALALTDMQVDQGPLFQEGYASKNRSTENIVIGMDNDLAGRPFEGLIDEVAIHAQDLSARQIHLGVLRRYASSGYVTSRPIVRPVGAQWQSFHASVDVPEGTRITFSLRDGHGNLIREDIAVGDSLADIDSDEIVLHAELHADDQCQHSPVLREWSISCAADSGAVVLRSVPFPDQTAAQSLERDDGDVTNKVVL